MGVFGSDVLCDLDYSEDVRADVDMNVVMTGSGEFIEVQGTAEGQPFARNLLDAQLSVAEEGIRRLTKLQQEALGDNWPFDS